MRLNIEAYYDSETNSINISYDGEAAGDVKKIHLYTDNIPVFPLPGYSDNKYVYSILEGNKVKDFIKYIEQQDIKVSGKEHIEDEEDFVVIKIALI